MRISDWSSDVCSSDLRIASEFPLEPVPSSYRGEVAARWRYADQAGDIGLITIVSQPFCGDCTRARLSPAGKLGRAAGRERVCQDGEISVIVVTFKKQTPTASCFCRCTIHVLL